MKTTPQKAKTAMVVLTRLYIIFGLALPLTLGSYLAKELVWGLFLPMSTYTGVVILAFMLISWLLFSKKKYFFAILLASLVNLVTTVANVFTVAIWLIAGAGF